MGRDQAQSANAKKINGIKLLSNLLLKGEQGRMTRVGFSAKPGISETEADTKVAAEASARASAISDHAGLPTVHQNAPTIAAGLITSHAESPTVHHTKYADGDAAVSEVKASDTLRNSNDTEKNTQSGTYIKLKETLLNADLPSPCRLKITTKRVSTYAYFKIYKNGSPLGAEIEEGEVDWVTHSQDLEGLVSGDLVQVYCKTAGTGYIKDFRFYYDKYIIEIGGKGLDTDLLSSDDPTISVTNQDP